jgi:hypothetical protein
VDRNDALPYVVERWASDGRHIEETIARCSRITVARAAFNAAISEYRDCVITLSQGMQLIDRTTIPDREHSA